MEFLSSGTYDGIGEAGLDTVRTGITARQEMVRRRDLIRYNQYSQGEWMFKPKRDKALDWFPIPRKMIETSGGLWTQNPGYTTDK